MEKIKENDPRFICKKNNGYTKAIEISNLRLRLTPHCVFYCEKDEDVIDILQYCKEHNKKFKIRSGGHHHEGACSGNEVIIIDTSRLNKIEIDNSDSDPTLTVGPGAKLEDIYSELLNSNKILPGGGCESVAIGGLVQGGGWGPYSRLLGMTCDSLIEADIVIIKNQFDNKKKTFKKFEKIKVSTTENETLFKAIKGSGGGNFGIVTKLKFKLYDLLKSYARPENHTNLDLKYVDEQQFQSNLLSFEIYIEDEQEARKQLENWLNNAHLADPRITSYSRVYPKTNKTRFYIGAKVLHGNPEYLSHYITSLLGNVPLKYRFEYKIQTFGSKETQSIETNLISKSYKNSAIDHFLLSKNSVISKADLNTAPGSTCDKPHPHKISSFFPKKDKNIHYENLNNELTHTIFKYMNQDFNYLDDKISSYLTLHGMGGAIQNGNNSFYYKDYPFIFQIQAWWDDLNTPLEDKYLSWVEGLRQKLSNLTEGCFVNFPDYNCILDKYHKFYDPNNKSQRQLLLEKFFGKDSDILKDLKDVKIQFDPDNFFKHEMSLIENK